MSVVETLREIAGWAPVAADDYHLNGDAAGETYWDSAAVRLDAIASKLSRLDPALLDFAGIVDADIAAAPLPDGWTAVVVDWHRLVLVSPGGRRRHVSRWGDGWLWSTAHAHLADVVAAVTDGG